MSLFTEIKDLFFSIQNENIPHSEKMEKLQNLINKNNKTCFENGVLKGMLDAKDAINKIINY